MSNQQNYTFGDSERAIERLAWLAEVFAPTSTRLLDGLSKVDGGALDLGCGPGYTTELIHQRLAPTWTIGLDASARMVELARARTQLPLQFIERDVTALPFPAAPAALIYARFLLTHLTAPAQRLRDWAAGLAPGGRLVLEETAFMRSEYPAFQSYYAHVQALQAHYGQNMLIGAHMAELCQAAGYAQIDAKVAERPVPAAKMARLHAANLPTWSQDPFARATFDAKHLHELTEELLEIAAGRLSAPPVSVGSGYVIATRA